jgi:hypothetical protein
MYQVPKSYFSLRETMGGTEILIPVIAPYEYIEMKRGDEDESIDGGCFALCERCWSELTPRERLPYYLQIWELWKRQGIHRSEKVWFLLEEAILNGK